MKIELIYDKDCPNVDATREHLRQACVQAGVTPSWKEWDRADQAAPNYVQQHGSPTVLIDGHDVGGLDEGAGNCCRVYEHEGQIHGVPPVAMIAARLGDATSSGGTLGSLVTIPAAIVSVMPALACPACWPAYASLLGSLGLGFMIESTYLMPITIVALLIAVGMLGVKARLRRGYGPLMLGLIGASLIVVAKFALGLDPLIYAGVALLIAASVWNIWPESRTKQACGSASCCTGSELNQAEVKDA